MPREEKKLRLEDLEQMLLPEKLGKEREMGVEARGTGGNSGGGPGRPALPENQKRGNNPELAEISYSHDAIVDALIQNPMLNGKQLGKLFGFHPAWINRITGSDAFKTRLMERKKELIDPIIAQNAEERLDALLRTSIDVLEEKLGDNPSAELALQAATLSSKALGYGARGTGTQVAVQANFVVAMPGKSPSEKEWAEGVKGMTATGTGG